MNSKQSLTPHELAHLCAKLVSAKLIEKGSGALHTVGKALDFITTCERALELDKLADEQAAQDEVDRRTQEFLRTYAQGSTVPVQAIVNHLQAQRIKPSADELKAIGERRALDSLTKQERIDAIFLVLTSNARSRTTNRVIRPFLRITEGTSIRPAPPIAERRRWLKNGVPIENAGLVADLMAMAQRERSSEKGKLGAQKKRKPRAPRVGTGFEKKPRSATGEWKIGSEKRIKKGSEKRFAAR